VERKHLLEQSSRTAKSCLRRKSNCFEAFEKEEDPSFANSLKSNRNKRRLFVAWRKEKTPENANHPIPITDMV